MAPRVPSAVQQQGRGCSGEARVPPPVPWAAPSGGSALPPSVCGWLDHCWSCTCGGWGQHGRAAGRWMSEATAVFSARRPPTMTTLLEIKSSVLRQVQVRPSFRRRTEGEPGSTGADPQEPTAAGAWWVPPPVPYGHVHLAALLSLAPTLLLP